MALHLHRAERADTLVGALADVLREPLDDPFATEVVSVPTPGVERWIAQRLSHRLGAGQRADGVCAGISFPSPRRLVAAALAGATEVPVDDPWAPKRAVWPLLRVIDEVRGEAWAELLWSYLGDHPGAGGLDPSRRGRRWGTAQHLASLFARYAATRPQMVLAWAAGHDIGADGTPLPPDRAWQAELWRRLRARVPGPDPVTRVQEATAALRLGGGGSDLPARLSVFGPTRLDPVHLDVLVALAAHREVHLWLPHPSPAAWAAVAEVALPPAPASLGLARADDPSGAAVRHRLLAYLGRDSRELQVRLRSALSAAPDLHHSDEHHAPVPAPTGPVTLLARLQHDLAADLPPRPAAERPVLAVEDRSVSVHACHGPHRQVEVLREVLVGLLEDDPTLQPRDIVVMCPDIETYAPLVAAAFGLDTEDGAAEHPGHRLRVRLADRALRQLNPVLAVVARVLDLVESRMTVSALLDLCAAPPVATRFRFSTDDLERLHELVPEAGVRWGLDATHRGRYAMAGFGQNTWAAGLDRLLLGVTMDETGARFIGTVLPLDDVDSGDVDLVGRLAEYLARLRRVVDDCGEPRTLPGWVALCRDIVELLTDVSPADRWQHTHAYAELARLQETGPADDTTTLTLAEVGALLAEAFRGRASRANFRTGTLTVCTMLPMRAVPHRVVCLLGVDDGLFPRRAAQDGDDLTRDREQVGDPDPPSEDRQLLLDAVLAAQDTLVLLFSGMDPRTGADLPPAVPVNALLDAFEQTVASPDDRPVREHLLVRHRLQPFDPDNFVPGALRSPQGFSFDRAGLRGVRAAARTPVEPPDPYAGVRLPALPDDRTVELAELARFFHHPVRALLRQRAGLVVGEPDEPPEEQIPVELDGLQRWSVGDRLLRAHLAGEGLDTLIAAEWRRGTVPPQAFGQRVLADVGATVATVAGSAAALLDGPPERADLVLDLGPVRLSGSVPGIRGETVVKVQYSRLSARHRVQGWVELLALTVARPGTPWRLVAVGRGSRFTLGPVPAAFATTVLADLVELQGTGLREPVPFSARTSYAYAAVRYAGSPWEQDARGIRSAWKLDRDDLWTRFLPPEATLEQLMAEPSRPAEERGALAEPTRFGTLARRVFHPLLSCTEA